MIRYFLKIALRYLWTHKTYSGLNYVCLTFGFACAVISLLYILNVFSYDKFHLNYNRLYSVEAMVTYFNGESYPKQYLSSSLPDQLKKNAPEIEEITRIADANLMLIKGENTFSANAIYTDSNFFDVFTFPIVEGNTAKLFRDVHSIMLSEKLAKKLFGNESCTGKIITLKNGTEIQTYTITGKFKTVPSQSSLQFDCVIPFTTYLSQNPQSADEGATSNATWITLNRNADATAVNTKIKMLIKNQQANLNQELFLFPLKDRVLYAYTGKGKVWRGMQSVMIVGAIGLVILLISCFNFINLAIAVNIKRYHEAGIKKVVGSKKSLIIQQFLGETFILIIFSLISAILIIALLLPFINAMINSNLNLDLLNLKFIALLAAILLISGIISGLFPGLYLASSNPLKVIKGQIATNKSYSLFRQGLIVFQFTIPVALIICMMIIRTQDRYMKNYDVGVDKSHLIIADNIPEDKRHAERLKSDLLLIKEVSDVSFTNCIPTRGSQVLNDISWKGKDPSEKIHFWCVNADYDYNKVVQLNILKGRYFNFNFPADSDCYIINDVAARIMKNDDPVGSSITVEGKKGVIIGVIANFHAIDLAGPMVPVVMRITASDKPIALIQFSGNSYSSVARQISGVYHQYFPDNPVETTLFRDLIPYSNLTLPSHLTGTAFVIALLLACMGLFGLASFTSESRTKEIGIRKTNGATSFSILNNLLSNYIKWLFISFFFACPIAFLAGKMFLSRFYFHTPVPLWTFIVGPVLAFTVALLTVSSLTWNIASKNPIEALRYE